MMLFRQSWLVFFILIGGLWLSMGGNELHAQAGVELSASAPPTFQMGERITYTLSLKNLDSTAIHSVTLQSAIPANAFLIEHSVGSTLLLPTDSLTWTFRNIPAYGQHQVSFVVTAATSLILDNYQVIATQREQSVQAIGKSIVSRRVYTDRLETIVNHERGASLTFIPPNSTKRLALGVPPQDASTPLRITLIPDFEFSPAISDSYNVQFANNAFQLHIQSVYTPSQAVTQVQPSAQIQLLYPNTDVQGIFERALGWHYERLGFWIPASSVCLDASEKDLDTNGNRLLQNVCLAGKYALFSTPQRVYLPCVIQ